MTAAADTGQTLLLEIYLNGQRSGQTLPIRQQGDGRLLAAVKDLAVLRFLPPPAAALHQTQPEWAYIDALGLGIVRLNAATQTLWLDAAADKFQPAMRVATGPSAPTPQMPSAGASLNYELTASGGGDDARIGSQVDLVAFANGWVADSRLYNPDLTDDGRFIRLSSTLTRDRPEHMDSLRFGDAISGAGSWGRPVHFGGIQWSSNFATQPEFITFPLPSISGSAALPSSTEVFVNNMRVYSGAVPAGPFSLNTLPVITGQGEMQMVVRDILGREQLVTQSFYASRELLKRGLHGFSYEIGAQRRNFGLASNDYGPWRMSGTHRYGFNESLTGEAHAEMAEDSQAAGVAAFTLMRNLGVVEAAVAGSHSDLGNGGLLVLGFDRKTQHLSLGIRNQMTTRDFRSAGQLPDVPAASRQTRAHVGLSDARLGSFGVGYFSQDNRDRTDNEIVTANYNRNLGRNWTLNLSAFKSLDQSQDYAFGLTLTHAFGERRSVSLNTSHGSDADRLLLQMQQSMPIGNGYGYRLLAGMEGSERLEGGLSMQNDYGTYRLEAARNRDADAYRASVSGSLAWLGGHAFLSRQLGDSFAVVRVPGYANVQIYAENQPVARTDRNGAALVPKLRPYQKNRISIEQSDLPLDAQIDSLEMNAVPYMHSGYDLAFPVRQAKAAVLKLVLVDGKPLAPGSVLKLDGRQESFPVGYRGQAYLTGLAEHNRLQGRLPDGRICEAVLDYPVSDEPLPDLGTVLCGEIRND